MFVGREVERFAAKKEPFEGRQRDWDKFEITIPEGLQVDELPPPVDIDYSFGSYHSKAEAKGNTLVYTRAFEIKQVSVPMTNMDELKEFYRATASDERGTVVLKPAGAR